MSGPPELPFINFETYRENWTGSIGSRTMARSDETLHFKDSGDVPVRVVIKWSGSISRWRRVRHPVVTVPEATAKPKP